MKVLVVGQSKTGTTALLAAISRSIGVEATHFEPSSLLDVDASGDNIIVKRLLDTFRWTEPPAFDLFDTRFLIYRDPRDRYISWLLYDMYGRDAMLDDERYGSWLELLAKKQRRPRSVSVTALTYRYWELTGVNLLHALGKTNEILVGLLRSHGELFTLVRYEDFVSGDTSAIEKALGLPVASTATVTGPESRVARTKGFGSWQRWFTPADLEVFRPFCSPILDELGYSDDWTLPRRPTITEAESTTYLESLRSFRRNETSLDDGDRS